MDEIDIKKQLKINKHRHEIIDALLSVHKHSNLIQAIKALSSDAKNEIMWKPRPRWIPKPPQ